MNKIFIGSSNKSKISDWKTYLGRDFKVLSPYDLKINFNIPESRDSLENNAILKALFWAKQSGLITLSEDSGFFIQGQENILGVNTKRWLKDNAIDDTNIAGFIKDLPNKKCYLKTAIAIANPEGVTHLFTHTVNGRLSSNYFSKNNNDSDYSLGKYFIENSRRKTWADMTEEERRLSDIAIIEQTKKYISKLIVYEEIRKEINNRPKKILLGFPTVKPDKLALDIFNYASSFQPNNCGFHTNKRGHKNPFKIHEIKAIKVISKFLGGNNEDGYINSGATESNLMGIWLAREEFKKNGEDPKNIVIFKTILTHYSVDKSINILNIEDVRNIKVNKNFTMDLHSFRKELNKTLKEGKSVIVIATAGYNVVGTIDNIKKINEIVNLSKKKGKIFIHVDAATLGFVSPFVDINSKYLRYENVKSVALDGHKLGLLPYPCGIFIVRKGLTRYISQKVEYLGSHDQTIIGSRTGASASALYAMVTKFGLEEYRKTAKKCLETKKYFITELKQSIKNIHIITSPFSIIFGVSFGSTLPKEIETKYGLHFTLLGTKNTFNNYYQIIVTPDIDKTTIDNFIQEVAGVNQLKHK